MMHILEVKFILMVVMVHKIQPTFKSFNRNGFNISSWESTGLLNEKINSASNSKNIVPRIVYENPKVKVNFSGNLLKQDKIYNHKKTVNICTVYRLSPHTSSNTDFTLKDCLFGAVELTKNLDPDKYNYSGYGIGFDSRSTFTHTDGSYGVNVIIFGWDLSNSSHSSNRNNNILILGRSLVQELNGVTLYAEKMYPTNFTVTNKTFFLSLHYNGDDSYLFVNGVEQIKSKVKKSEIKPYPLCLGNISKDFSSTNAEQTGLYGYMYYFSVDYWPISNHQILYIHRYLMKKRQYHIKCLCL